MYLHMNSWSSDFGKLATVLTTLSTSVLHYLVEANLADNTGFEPAFDNIKYHTYVIVRSMAQYVLVSL